MKDARDSKFREAREHPDVKAVLARFPGAEIIDVRDAESIAAASEEKLESGTDEEPR